MIICFGDFNFNFNTCSLTLNRETLFSMFNLFKFNCLWASSTPLTFFLELANVSIVLQLLQVTHVGMMQVQMKCKSLNHTLGFH